MKLKEIIPEWRYYRDNHGYGEAELRALAAYRIKNAKKQEQKPIEPEAKQDESFKDWVLNSHDKTAGAIRGYAEAWGTRPLLALKGMSDTLGITEPDENNRFAKLQHHLDKKRQEVSEANITPERKQEIDSLAKEMQEAEGFWENIKAGGKYLLDTATHPSEWSTQGIVSQLAPETILGFGAGGIAAKAATKLGKRLAIGAGVGVAENMALGSGYNYLAERGEGKTHDEAKKTLQQGIVLDAAVGGLFGLAGAGVMHHSLSRALKKDTDLKMTRSVDDVENVHKKVDYDDMQISMMLNQGKEVSPEVSGANILVKLKNTIEDGTFSEREVYEKLGEYGLNGYFRMTAFKAYQKGDASILGKWMDQQMSKFQKLETTQTKQTPKPTSEFDKALGDLGENDLPTLNKNADNINQNSITTNEKALNKQQSVGRQIKGENFVMNEGKQSYPDRIKFELSEYLKANTDINENPITASLNYLYNHHKDDGMFKSRKEVYELIKNVLDDVPDVVRKQNDGTYYFAKSVKQEPTNRKSIMQDIVLEPKEAENYIKHANTKPYNKEMSDKLRADGGSIQSPQFPQGAKTLENPELKNFSSAGDIIPQNQIKGENFVASEPSKTYYPENATIDIDEALRNEHLKNDNPVVASIAWLYERHPEMFKSKADVYRTIQAVKENPDLITSGKSADSVMFAKKLNDEKMGDMVISRGDENKIIHANKKKVSELDRKLEPSAGSPISYTPVKQAGAGANAHSTATEASNTIIPHPNENININSLKANDNINFHAKIFNPKTRNFDLVLINSKVIKTKDGFTYAIVKDKHGFTALDIKSGARIATAKNANELSKTIDDFNAKWGKEYFEFSSKHTLDLDNAKRNNAPPELIKQIDDEFIAIKDKYALTKDGWGNPTIKFADFLKKNGIEQNTIYAKGGDNLMAGVASSIEEDENGNLSINPTKFIAGLGGYTVAKKLLQNPKVQQGFKNTIGEQIAKQKRTKDIINHIENSPRKGTNLPIVAPKDLSEAVLSYIKTNRRKVTIQRVPEYLKESLAKKFGYKHVNDIRRTINGDDINHVLKRHGNADIELSRNQEAITLKDIQEYPNFVNNADIQSLRTTKNNAPAIISGKQINGHYVIVEEVQTKQNELAFKTMYKVKGKLSENKMFRQSEASHFRVIRTATTNPLSNFNTIPNHPQKVNEQIAKLEAKADNPAYYLKKISTSKGEQKAKNRLLYEKFLNIKPIKEFGINYAEFYHNGTDATKKLLKEKKGQVVGAFHREDLGDIDLVWGNENFGLAHILSKRSKQWGEDKALKFISHLDENIKNGHVVQLENGRVGIKTPETTIVLDKKNNNKFIITAFRDKNNKKQLGELKSVQSETYYSEDIETNAKDSSFLSQTNSNDKILPNHPQKVKPADLTGNKLKGEYIKQKLESDTPHSMLYEADDIFVKDGEVNLNLDIKDKRILKYLKDNGFKSEGGKISAKATDEAIEIASKAKNMAYKKRVDEITKKMLEC